jgi:N-acetylglutamate synthase-like GNAT family acetyltransferase
LPGGFAVKMDLKQFNNEIVDYQKDDFYITSDSRKIDVDVVCSLLKESYWANTRKRDVIIKSFESSLCFSLFHKDKQIGFTRVITDCATFAYLCDVIISDEYRNNGLGQWLIECVFKHPDLENLRRWVLITRDAQEFYKNHGFTSLNAPERYMEIFNG